MRRIAKDWPLQPFRTSAARLGSAVLLAGLLVTPVALAEEFPVGPLEPVPVVRQRPEWSHFVILVWQWQNDVRQDLARYQAVGLRGFHIDRGAGAEELVRFSRAQGWPYYVDHAAGKGILHLTRDNVAAVRGQSQLLVRPWSLADPATVRALQDLLRANVRTTRAGLVYAYAFDDEISLGSFNTPAEVDIHPRSLAWYRQWLPARYQTIARLNQAWGTAYPTFDSVQPVSFEAVRIGMTPPLAAWKLAPWVEWRHFMDYQFAQVLADLTRFTNTLDPATPAGFVGGQTPSGYGGYDYALLARAVQWMEGEDDLLRSFWNRPRRPRVRTFGLGPSVAESTWRLWDRLAHGHQATIAWPEKWFRDNPATGQREVHPQLASLAPVIREIQGPVSEFLVHPDTSLEPDPIGIYYSQPSIRVSWAMDALTHGSRWPQRFSSIDDDNLTSDHLRRSWGTLLRDLGYQYDYISYLDVQEGRLDLAARFKVIILPQALALSDTEAAALTRFVEAGGTLIADNLCGLLTETGRGRRTGALDRLFGVLRDERQGYLNGRTLTEIDAERAKEPLPRRLHAYDGALRKGALVVYERGTRVQGGTRGAHYLNLTPAAYWHPTYRFGAVGAEWRALVGGLVRDAGLPPRVQVEGTLGIEALLWRNGAQYYLVLIDTTENHAGPAREITVRLRLRAKAVRNLRTHRAFGDVSTFTDTFVPAEANLYAFSVAVPPR